MKGMNINKLAKEMMAKLESTKEDLAKRTCEASAGGGMVTVVARGDNRIVSIRIDPEVAKAGDLEMLQDLIMAATNQALKNVQEMVAGEMGKLTGGFKIPGLM